MAQLLGHVNELVETLDDLRNRRDELKEEILDEEEERYRIQQELDTLNERLLRVNDVIQRGLVERKELDKTIQETEHTKNKIVESFKTLLQVLQRESQYHIPEQ